MRRRDSVDSQCVASLRILQDSDSTDGVSCYYAHCRTLTDSSVSLTVRVVRRCSVVLNLICLQDYLPDVLKLVMLSFCPISGGVGVQGLKISQSDDSVID